MQVAPDERMLIRKRVPIQSSEITPASIYLRAASAWKRSAWVHRRQDADRRQARKIRVR
jgi:hypothetical protein